MSAVFAKASTGSGDRASLRSLNAVLYSWQRVEFRQLIIGMLDALIRTEGAIAGGDGGGARVAEPDDLSYITTVLKSPACPSDLDVFERLVKLLSLLLRCERNALVVRGATVQAILDVSRMCAAMQLDTAPCIDCCQCIFRAASLTAENHFHLLDTMPFLAHCLALQSARLHEVACVCVQVLCATSVTACELLVQCGGVSRAAALLFSGDEAVLTRALGVLQTTTRDLGVCRAVASCCAVPPLLLLVGHRTKAVACAAGGVLQNLGREKDVCAALRSGGVVDTITPLLLNGDPELQSVAIGVLLNTHIGDDDSRSALKRVLADVVASAAVEEVLRPLATADLNLSRDPT